MNRLQKISITVLVLFSLVLIAPIVFAAAGFESLFNDVLYSRGMMLYYAAFVLLIAVPFLNRYLAIVAVYFILFSLSRGIMRISGEQDILKAAFSAAPGFDLGIKIALPVFTVALLWAGLNIVLKKMRFVSAPQGEEILERINAGRRKGKTLKQIGEELAEEGTTPAEMRKAMHSMEEKDI